MSRSDSSSSSADITSLSTPSSGSLDNPDSFGLAITCHRLTGNNYLEWSQSVKIHVAGRGRSGYLTGSSEQPNATTDAAGSAKWLQENNQVMSWLLNSMIPSIGRNFLLYNSATEIWTAVQETYSSKDNDSALYGIEEQIFALKQKGMGVTAYYNSLQSLWQQIYLYESNEWSTPNDDVLYQTLLAKRRVFRFLHGLNKEIDHLRGRVLSTSPLPSLREVFSMVKKEESRREVMLSPTPIYDGSALLTHSSSTQSRKSRPWCDHCKKLGHVRDKCWKLHRKPVGWMPRGFPDPNSTANDVAANVVVFSSAANAAAAHSALDGRVKTLHPNIHGGILARRDLKHHMEALNDHGIGTFDVVVVNLYPFYDKVTSAGGIAFDDGVENIDIGGPAMIRAAAKNHKDVLVVVDSLDYPALLEFLEGGQDDQQFRRKLAWKAFAHVASYDSAVSEWLWEQTVGDKFPPNLTMPLSLKSSLRYGENPHQKAAFYVDKSLSEVNAGGIATAVQHHGKEMSYNNYLDADVAWNCVSEFRNPTCVIVKHTNPCGVASRDDILEAYRLAVKADPVLAKEIREFRSPTDGETRMFYEIVVAPKYTEKGLEILRGKSKTLRILEAKKNEKGKLSLRQFNVVSEKKPQDSELRDAEFAWLCVKHVKSNTIVIAKDNCMLGMGSGQPNCLESLRIAFRKAGDEVKGAALASDAFFPFAWKDAVEEACENGIGVIAEPGGSIRDGDAVDCCNKYGVSLLFTNVRHFKH
ncbi:hypothetical protein GQ457_15G016580 [Hibiscus cannabinus]